MYEDLKHFSVILLSISGTFYFLNLLMPPVLSLLRILHYKWGWCLAFCIAAWYPTFSVFFPASKSLLIYVSLVFGLMSFFLQGFKRESVLTCFVLTESIFYFWWRFNSSHLLGIWNWLSRRDCFTVLTKCVNFSNLRLDRNEWCLLKVWVSRSNKMT